MLSVNKDIFVKWICPKKISLCSVNLFSGQIILTSGSEIFYILITDDKINLIGHISCENEISCVDISPISK